MKKKAREKPVQVTLKPIFGIAPGKYLSALYAVLILLVLFLILLFPGIMRNGTKITFSGSPEQAAVYVDGTYIGSGSFTAFVERGSHDLLITYPGFTADQRDISTRGRIFGSLIFPRREQLDYELALHAFDEFVSFHLNRIYPWSLVGSYTKRYHYPPLFRQFASDAVTAGLDEGEKSELQQVYHAAAAMIGSLEMLQDYRDGQELLSAGFGMQFEDADFLGRLEQFFAGETVTLPGPDSLPGSIDSTRNTVLGTAFFTISGGTYTFPLEDPLPALTAAHTIGARNVPEFLLAAREVTEQDYAAFVTDTPFWSLDNISELTELQLVDEFYLGGVDLGNPTLLPVRNVSWNAAAAYVEWYNGKLDETALPYRAQLPDALQWQLAAFLYGQEMTGSLQAARSFPEQPQHLLGNLWEYTADTFFYGADIDSSPLAPYLRKEHLEKIVVGGSYVNDPDGINAATIGSLPASTCSDFTGFRLVLIPGER